MNIQIPLIMKRSAAVRIPVRLNLRGWRNGARWGLDRRQTKVVLLKVREALDPFLPH